MTPLRERLSLNMIVLIFLLVIAFGSSVFSAVIYTEDKTSEWWSGWSQNFSTEVFGAIMTFALFELLVGRQKEERDLKARLIRQAGSDIRNTAITAVNELNDNRWLQGKDGILQGKDLVRADLSRANLQLANLQEADLTIANLQGALLQSSSFIGAILTGVNLENAQLEGANLERANLINANLEGANLENASLKNAILESKPIPSLELRSTIIYKTKFNEMTILPDGTNWTPDTDMERFTDPHHIEFDDTLPFFYPSQT